MSFPYVFEVHELAGLPAQVTFGIRGGGIFVACQRRPVASAWIVPIQRTLSAEVSGQCTISGERKTGGKADFDCLVPVRRAARQGDSRADGQGRKVMLPERALPMTAPPGMPNVFAVSAARWYSSPWLSEAAWPGKGPDQVPDGVVWHRPVGPPGDRSSKSGAGGAAGLPTR